MILPPCELCPRRCRADRARGSLGFCRAGAEPRAVTCPITLDGTLGRVWRGDVKANGIVFPPNEAAVFEIK